MDIIIIALSRWDGKYSSTVLSLAKVFARTHRVFYIDNPFTIKDVISGFYTRQISRRIQALFRGKNIFFRPIHDLPNFVAVTPRMTLPVNWLPGGWLFSTLSALNDRIVFKAIRKTIDRYGIKDFIYLNSFNPLYGNYFPKNFKPTLSIYHCVDDISRSPYVFKHGTRLEMLTMRRSDLVITTSAELQRIKSRVSEKVHILANAANVSLFQQAVYHSLAMPPEIKQIPPRKKLIAYMGNICHRLDYDLLLAIADAYRDHILLMIGPFGHVLYKKSGLNQRPNVIFTGEKELEELPAYLQYSHCCIIPFLCNSLTKSIYPLKINEYLSAGKPVVTTPFSEDVLRFDGVVYVAKHHDEFVRKIDEAIRTDNDDLRKKRVALSAGNSWESRAEEFWKIIDRVRDEK